MSATAPAVEPVIALPVQTRRSRWPPVVLALALFAIYARGAAPTIFVGDSGDLATAVATMGIAHPSGYPLYILLGKLWTLAVPFGSVAWRLGLFSAACAAASGALLFAIARRLEAGGIASLAGALLLAWAPSFWAEANVPRVYALSSVFVLAALGLAVRWREERRDRLLVLAAFVCGLGASNHTFVAVEGAALAVWVVASEPAILRRFRTIGACLVAAAAGLLPYLYLPIRAAAGVRLNWGNPRTLPAVVDVALRRSFWGRAWIRSGADLLPIAADYVRSFAVELTLAGVGLAVIGILAARRRRSVVPPCLLVMAANLATMALHGSRSDLFLWHRYYIPSYAMAALLAALGAGEIAPRVWPAARPLLLAPAAVLLVTGFAPNDRSRFRVGHDFTRMVFASLPPGSHLIAEDDNILFALMYEHLAEGARPDVDLILEGVGGANLPPLSFQPERDPVYLTHHPNWAISELAAVPVGVVFRAWPARRPPPPLSVPAEDRLEGEDDPRVPKDYLTANLIGHFHYMLGVTFEATDWLHARREFEKAQAASPNNDVLFYNLGLIYARNGLYEDGAAAFRRSAEINPRPIPSPRPPRLAAERAAEMDAAGSALTRFEDTLAADSALRAATPLSEAWHRRLGELALERGDAIAARRHVILALEARPASP